MGMIQKALRYFKHFVLLALLQTLTACVLFGTPDSPMVNLVGRDMENFNDMTKNQEKVLELNNVYLILYKQTLPNARTRFALLDTATGFDENILVDSQNIQINHGFLLSNKNLIAFIVSYGGFIDLILYDYKKRINLDEKVIIESNTRCTNPEEKYTSKKEKTIDLTPSLVFSNCKSYLKVSYVEFSKDKRYIFIKLVERSNESLLHPEKKEEPIYSMKCFQIEEDKLIDCSNLDKGRFEMAKDVQTGYKFTTSNGNMKSLFIIEPVSDYLPANYKPKYRGLHIRDENSKQDYLISKNYNLSSYMNGSEPVWLDDGKMVAYDSNILDCTGKLKEKKLVDGIIVHMIKK
jgi:hypothetical protein